MLKGRRAIRIIIPVMLAMTLAASPVVSAQAGLADHRCDGVLNAVYRIDNQTVHLVAGRAAREVAPGSAARIITRVVAGPVFGDLNGGGQEEAAILLSQETDGSGTFFYVAAATAEDSRWQGTHAVFIGDRVDPQTIRIGDGVILVRYLDRRHEESMVVIPSVEKVLKLELVGGHLEVLQP